MRASDLISKSALLAVLCLASWVHPNGALGDPTLTTLHSFTGNPDGSSPYAGLIFDKSGALYGATELGGATDYGTVFKLTRPARTGGAWTESVLYSFTGTYPITGNYPYAGLIFDESGALYGTTLGGGVDGYGTVFKLMPPAKTGGAWTESVLYSFTGGNDGFYPSGLIFDESGALYGTTEVGGAANDGTVFKLTPPARTGGVWTESVLYSFMGTEGRNPIAGLIFDKSGALYGTTAGGGADGYGAVFKLTPPARTGGVWIESVLYSFTGSADGAQPEQAVLIFDKSGALYGTTAGGGAAGLGTVYKLTPPARTRGAWTESVLHSFTGDPDGSTPYAGLIFDKSGALYGTTNFGGDNDYGTVYKVTPPARTGGAWTESVLHSFTGGPDGRNPNAVLIFDKSGALYSTTIGGGAGDGTVFKLTESKP